MRILTGKTTTLLITSLWLWGSPAALGSTLEPNSSASIPVWQEPEEEAEDEEAPPEDKREEIKELLSQLKGHIGKRGKEDKEAGDIIEQLMGEYPKSGPKDQESIAKGMGACLKVKRKQDKEGNFDNALYGKAAFTLGTMGDIGAKELVKWVGHKQHRGNLGLQVVLIKSLGKTKSPLGVKTLTDLLGNKDHAIEAEAAKALFHFDGLKLKERKKVFNEVLKALMSAKNAKDADTTNQDTTAQARYGAVSAPMISTLEALSGHKEGTPEAWQSWWNKNKKDDWDKDKS